MHGDTRNELPLQTVHTKLVYAIVGTHKSFGEVRLVETLMQRVKGDYRARQL